MVDVKAGGAAKKVKEPKPDPVPIIKVGDIVENKYEVRKTLGQGAFGAVFEVRVIKTNELYALKMELEASRENEPGLSLEVGVLKRIQHSVHAVRYIDSGFIGKLGWLVMQLVGCNLSELRKACPNHYFTLCTALRLGLQCLEAMEAIHESGLLHRDIKPSNCALGRSIKDCRNVYLLDFGLVRKYRLKNGKIRPPRYACGFRGTTKYASLNIHAGNDWGRVDDCWCWLYLLVEFQKGGLPWRLETERDKIADLKVKYRTKLFRGLEPENVRISNNLDTLKYADDPPYFWYRQQLNQIMDRKSMLLDEPYDWEPEGQYYKQLKKICPQPYECQMKETNKTIKEGEETDADISTNENEKNK